MQESMEFQLTTSRRGRRYRNTNIKRIKRYFNSRPHEEVDSLGISEEYGIFISTHDLTKRSTKKWVISIRLSKISTHDLTKRSTRNMNFSISMHIFQLTTSRRGRLSGRCGMDRWKYFNSRPHEEVDTSFLVLRKCFLISTHDLTKRSTL